MTRAASCVGMRNEIRELMRRGGGVVDRRAHPHLHGAFDWALRQGELAPVLPGVYAAPTEARALAARDDALRRRIALDDLNLAVDLVPHRRGHASRRRWLAESTGRPFSAAERRAQGLLRDAGVTGWVGNLEFRDDDGQLVAIGDLVFERLHLIMEIDGSGHLTPEQLRHDRTRDLSVVGGARLEHPPDRRRRHPRRRSFRRPRPRARGRQGEDPGPARPARSVRPDGRFGVRAGRR